MERGQLSRALKARARALGFQKVGIAPVAPPATGEAYRRWVEAGYAGDLWYLTEARRRALRLDPRRLVPGARSLVVVAFNYYAGDLPPEVEADPSRGIFARYAWGPDYHRIVKERLRALHAWVEAQVGRPVAGRAFVDTGPVLERDHAVRAGLGFIGRNTLLIDPEGGSWTVLGLLFLDLELEPDEPDPRGTCGRCTRCLDVCPTDAFAAPYVLDARRCISTLTIENKGPIPPRLRPRLGNRVFGCDLCIQVCPWTRRFARPRADDAFPVDLERRAPPLLELIGLDAAAFRARFRGTAVERAKRRGLLRNVAVALGNWGDPRAVPALAAALADPEPLIRGHAAWALGRIGGRAARRALEAARAREEDPYVREEIEAALEGRGPVLDPEGG